MLSASRRQSRVGRWFPLFLYAIAVLGWVAEGLSDEAVYEYLGLVVWTLPAPVLYEWRTRRRR